MDNAVIKLVPLDNDSFHCISSPLWGKVSTTNSPLPISGTDIKMDQREAKIWWARDKKRLREQRTMERKKAQLTSVFSACIPSWPGLDSFLSLLGFESIIPWVNSGCADGYWEILSENLTVLSSVTVTDIIDFPDVVSVWVTLLVADEAVGRGRGGVLLFAGHHAVPQLRAGRWREVSRDRDTCGHVTQVTTSGLSTRVIGAQADQVTIRLLQKKIGFYSRHMFSSK